MITDEPTAAVPAVGSVSRALGGAAWHRKRLVITVVAVIVVLSVSLPLVTMHSYSAKSYVLVNSLSSSGEGSTPDSMTQARDLSGQVAFAEGDQILQAVSKFYGTTVHLSVTADSTANVLVFASTASQRRAAVDSANSFSKAYLRERTSSFRDGLQSQITGLVADLQSLNAAPNSTLGDLSLQRANIASKIAGLRFTYAGVSAGSVTRSAEYDVQESPDLVVDLVVGVVLGLLIAMLIVAELERRVGTVRG